jgi:hypothetical protein
VSKCWAAGTGFVHKNFVEEALESIHRPIIGQFLQECLQFLTQFEDLPYCKRFGHRINLNLLEFFQQITSSVAGWGPVDWRLQERWVHLGERLLGRTVLV